MKNIRFYFLFTAIFLFTTIGHSQEQEQSTKKLYSSASFEMIFSFADVNSDSANYSNILRFAPVFNFQWLINYDMSKNFGVFSGIDMRNLGFIRNQTSTNPQVKFKHRSYMLGLPVGIKVGNLDKGTFIYLGGQIEWGFAYKQKEFINNNKNKFKEWNSDRMNQWQPSVFIGINLPYGTNIKFKYYLNNFLNEDYVQYDANGGMSKPYAGQNSQIFYFSLNFMMFEPIHEYKEKF